jgi:hypothetical protein
VAKQRIRGQEVQLLITRGADLEDTLTEIQNFNFEPEFEIKSQGYLGEKTNRKDSIYNGCKGDFELHLHSSDWFRLLAAIKDKASRVQPDLVFNVVAICNFPDGTTPTVLFPDVAWGATPVAVSSRGDYVKVKMSFECDDFQPQL